MEDIGSEEEVSHSTGWGPEPPGYSPTAPTLSAINISPGPRGVRPSAPEGMGGSQLLPGGPGPQLVWGKMGGSLREAIQTLSFGGKKAKEKHVFIT